LWKRQKIKKMLQGLIGTSSLSTSVISPDMRAPSSPNVDKVRVPTKPDRDSENNPDGIPI
jgi:hypothetical protein